jgi:hypothetical protein
MASHAQDQSSTHPPVGHTEAVDKSDGLPPECLEWCPICRTADILRAGASPEVRAQWTDIQREALATLRAVLDHYSRRLDEDAARNASSRDEPPID